MPRNSELKSDDPVQVMATKDGKAALVKWIKGSRLKPSMGPVVGAMLQWFCKQADVVTTAILADVDQGMEHAYAAALRKLADELEKGPKLPQAPEIGVPGDEPSNSGGPSKPRKR